MEHSHQYKMISFYVCQGFELQARTTRSLHGKYVSTRHYFAPCVKHTGLSNVNTSTHSREACGQIAATLHACEATARTTEADRAPHASSLPRRKRQCPLRPLRGDASPPRPHQHQHYTGGPQAKIATPLWRHTRGKISFGAGSSTVKISSLRRPCR